MLKTLSFFLAVLLSAALVAGCSNGRLNSGDAGTVLGGVLGGAAGSQVGSGTGQTIATVVGTLAGAVLGRRLGQNMGRSDRQQFGSALENNKTGDTSSWSNPDTNDQYSVTPTQTYTHANGNQPCRQFTMDARVNGQPDKVTGTACRQSNGTWKVQS